jgi:hypothetical protein
VSRVGSKEKIRQYLLANIGRIIESSELQDAADGAVQYSRRLRELRQDEGWKILTHNDDTRLKPGQYLLEEEPPTKGSVTFTGPISARLLVARRGRLTVPLPGSRLLAPARSV